MNRPPFRPSPRPVATAAVLRRAELFFAASSAGFRRAAQCPALYTRAAPQTWRWACQPAGYPLHAGRGDAR